MSKNKDKKFLIRKIRRALNKNKDFANFYKVSYTKHGWKAGISSSHMKEKY